MYYINVYAVSDFLMNKINFVGGDKAFASFQKWLPQVWRCLSLDLIPVSIRLRSTIKTPKGKQIIKKVERALLNERIRSINNTLNMLEQRRDTCIFQLEEKLDRESMEECWEFIKIKREARHLNTLDRQRNKLERLCQRNENWQKWPAQTSNMVTIAIATM